MSGAPDAPRSEARRGEHTNPSSFGEAYDQSFDYVWRLARRLGVAHDAIDDVVQETFLVVHRRFDESRAGAFRPWVYGITVYTVRNHRRSLRRKRTQLPGVSPTDPDTLADAADGPERLVQKAEAARVLHAILHELDDDKREVFVLVDLEQLSVTDAAEVLAMKLNTVYSRLRLARAEFEEAVRRHRARDTWRMP